MKEQGRIALNVENVLVLPRQPQLVLQDIPGPDGLPLAFTPWKLMLGERVLESGRSDAAGRVDITVELEEGAELELHYPGRTLVLTVPMREPVTTTAGVQLRLAMLGYDTGDVDDLLGPRTEQALRDFQRDQELEETGAADDATRARLEEVSSRRAS